MVGCVLLQSQVQLQDIHQASTLTLKLSVCTGASPPMLPMLPKNDGVLLPRSSLSAFARHPCA